MATEINPQQSEVRKSILAVGQRIMASKGFCAVGINEILTAASVPKGSFYHYFGSKDAFGVAMLGFYFEGYLAEMDDILGRAGLNSAQRLMNYFHGWKDSQSLLECQGKCLAVKLGAEVADLSEPMRLAMKQGTSEIISRLQAAVEAGQAEHSIALDAQAQSLYQLWLGASVLAKIERSARPLELALATTRRLLQPPA